MEYSLKHILKTASEILGVEVQFASNCIGEPAKSASDKLQAGQVLLLENLRFHAEEEAGDVAFAKELASLGDIYVNDVLEETFYDEANVDKYILYLEEKKNDYEKVIREIEI